MDKVMISVVALVIAMVLVAGINSYLKQQSRKVWLGLTWSRRVRGEGSNSLLTWLASRLTQPRDDIEKKIIAAGFYNRAVVSHLARVYFPGKLLLAVLSGAVVYLALSSELSDRLVMILLVAIGWILLPDMWLERRKKKRTVRVSGNLPYLLELMAVCVQTGMTIEAAIEYLSHELKGFDRDLAYLMEITASRARMSGTQQALNDLSEQLPSREMQSFIHTLQQSLRYGSSLFVTLTTQAGNLREVNMLTLEEKVAKLSAKLSVPLILFIMFPLVILMTAPGIMRMMSNAAL
ncbi:type II secretion system F family protein [Parendozoicomonas haliclonae]|uniref:Bacterial type II secretion system protein F domain protein n=1 Tax=Parendozoicomonas haliclonae TaxID=1960125 RepID=A0A1X7AK45_9GAMM|nr:type II secretion system F family protein [Parendozoicomonas haliclonae]SMA47544.1 Bacterial type II secretion system protein F domain protein [Parendozoicomonas haliclonae]